MKQTLQLGILRHPCNMYIRLFFILHEALLIYINYTLNKKLDSGAHFEDRESFSRLSKKFQWNYSQFNVKKLLNLYSTTYD